MPGRPGEFKGPAHALFVIADVLRELEAIVRENLKDKEAAEDAEALIRDAKAAVLYLMGRLDFRSSYSRSGYRSYYRGGRRWVR